MSKRILNISPYHIGTLEAFTKVVEILSEKFDKGLSYNFKNLFFLTMLQSGVDGFRFYGNEYEKYIDSDFIKNKTSIENFDKIKLKFDGLDKVMQKHSLTKLEKDDEEFSSIKYFLVDLFLARDTNRSMVTTLGIPPITILEGKYKPEFVLALKNLWECISTVNIECPMPILTYEKKDIKIFEEIISSDLFDEYVLSQKELENKNNKISEVVSYIKEKSINIIKKFKQKIYLKESMIKVVDVSNKFVNVFGNNVTSFLSNNLRDEFEKLLNNNNRIVIYNFDQIVNELVIQRIKRLKG